MDSCGSAGGGLAADTRNLLAGAVVLVVQDAFLEAQAVFLCGTDLLVVVGVHAVSRGVHAVFRGVHAACQMQVPLRSCCVYGCVSNPSTAATTSCTAWQAWSLAEACMRAPRHIPPPRRLELDVYGH